MKKIEVNLRDDYATLAEARGMMMRRVAPDTPVKYLNLDGYIALLIQQDLQDELEGNSVIQKYYRGDITPERTNQNF